MKTFFICALAILTLLEVTESQLIAGGVTCNDIKTIVNKHNDLRRMIASGRLAGQPKASNMKRIVWDDRLQAMAQSWANRMTFVHNPNRQDNRFKVGENMYISMSTSSSNTPEWDRAIQTLFNEHTKYRFSPCCSNFQATGHYTQIAWADTIYVGCGYAVYMKNNIKHKFYVCDYGKAGNMNGQYPYKTGAGCEGLCCEGYCKTPYGSKCA